MTFVRTRNTCEIITKTVAENICKIFQSSSNIANTIAKKFAAKYFPRYVETLPFVVARSAIKTGEKLFKDVIARYCTVMKMSSMFMGRFIYNPRSGNSRRKRRCYKFVTLVAVFSSYIIFVSLAGILRGCLREFWKNIADTYRIFLRRLYLCISRGEAICKFKSVQLLIYYARDTK